MIVDMVYSMQTNPSSDCSTWGTYKLARAPDDYSAGSVFEGAKYFLQSIIHYSDS